MYVRESFRAARMTGTLSPLESFAGELGIDFPHRLEAPHVINVPKQCLVTSVGFFDGVSLDARQDDKHKPGMIEYFSLPTVGSRFVRWCSRGHGSVISLL